MGRPKGPSTDRREKRLAVRQPDYPLDYAITRIRVATLRARSWWAGRHAGPPARRVRPASGLRLSLGVSLCPLSRAKLGDGVRKPADQAVERKPDDRVHDHREQHRGVEN